MAKVLLLTVGTGNVDDLEGSLLSPLRLSVARGDWERVVLLPSTVTRAVAARLAGEGGETRLGVVPLAKPDQENDADACFAHFEAEIEKLRREGFAPADIMVDFTRGTKAMSAALVLAAVAHELPRLRYIGGTRDNRGMVVAGTEEIRETSPAAALALRRIDLARRLVEGGAFAAALELLPDPDHPLAAVHRVVPDGTLVAMRAVARFLAAWDRLDYGAAAAVERPAEDVLPDAWQALCPTEALRDWVSRLAAKPQRNDFAAMALWLRPLMIDLLANAERRVRQHQFEDALVRVYRVVEMIGQARLFDRGIDSENVPEAHPDVVALRQRLAREKSSDFGRDPRGGLTAPRRLVGRLLKRMHDSLAPRLLAVGERHEVKARNQSVLIHGFERQAPSGADEWRTLFADLWALLERDRPGEGADIEMGRRLARLGTEA